MIECAQQDRGGDLEVACATLSLFAQEAQPSSTYKHLIVMASAADAAGALLVTHRGSCHCKRVRFEVDAGAHLVVWDCNCSVCKMKRNTHFVVPSEQFRLLTSPEELTTYTFNTGVAKHMFCRTCGVQAFYSPRSNPDGVAVTIHCIDLATVASVTTKQYDGVHWEASYEATGIAAHSKSAHTGSSSTV